MPDGLLFFSQQKERLSQVSRTNRHSAAQLGVCPDHKGNAVFVVMQF